FRVRSPSGLRPPWQSIREGAQTVTRRHRWVWLLGVGALAVALSLLAAGCGGGGKKSSQGQTSTTGGTASKNAGRTFPTFRVTWDAPDYFDPGLSYTVTGWQIIQHVYLGLRSEERRVGKECTPRR